MESKAERSQRLETVVAILIAVVTMIGAVVAWRSSVADDGAGDADFAGLRASVRAEETRALNSVDAYENYGAYMNYRRYNEMGNLIEADQLRDKANWLLAAVAILAIALVFYTLVESFGDRMRYVMVALGSLCMVAGTVFALFIEFRI